MKWKVILIVTLLLVLWAGYVTYAVLTLQPDLRASWGYVDDKKTEIWIDAELGKPLLVPAKIENLSITFADVPVAWIGKFEYGATKSDARVAIVVANDNLMKALASYMDNGQKGTVSVHIEGRFLWVVPINLNFKETINENILRYLNFTAKSEELAGGLIKSPALVETTFEWIGEENDEMILIAHMKMYNPNQYSIPIGKLSFKISANGVEIGGGETVGTTILPPKGYETVNVKTYLKENSITKAWELHVKNGELSKIKADIYLTFNVMGTEYEFKMASYEETIKTNIIGDINEVLKSLTSR